jgi:hypothetical protein
VENRFDFTSLNQCTFRWQLGWYPDSTDPTNALNSGFLAAVDSGEFAGPAVAPAGSGLLNLNLPGNWATYDALRVIARDPYGHEIYTWTWPLHGPVSIRSRITQVATANQPVITAGVNGAQLSVTNGPRVFRFDLTSGRLISSSVSNASISLSNGPRPVAGTWTITNVTHGLNGGEYVITMNDVTSAADGFEWRVRSNGWVNLRYRYTLTGTQTWFGVTFDYPEANVTAMRWLGQGPYRVWKNRLAGQEVAVHYKTANNTDTGKQWGYPEFRGYHGQLNWATLDTTQARITIAATTSNLFFRLLTPPVASQSRPGVSPAFPAGNISLLHAINAIGTKFMVPDVDTTGPESAAPLATGIYTGDVDIFFGELPVTGADRDQNGLSDVWELAHFNALGQDPYADPDGDGLKLLLENAFGLSPAVVDASSPRLPLLVVPGANTPAGLGYRVPSTQTDEFRFVPEISDDLQTWFDADTHPDYFLITSGLTGDEQQFTVERGAGWPGSEHQIFIRLRIERK